MKPKDLKCPFRWDERCPILSRGVLFVPQYYDKHEEWKFPGLSDGAVFGNDQPVMIEYCAGNGAWIVDKALKEPYHNWIAVEKRFDRVRKIWSKVQNFALRNLFVVCGEALTFTKYYLPSAVVQRIYVNFPDPWPKEKHAKHRLIQAPFVEQIARIVVPQGEAVLVTDDAVYREQMQSEMSRLDYPWQSVFPDPFYVTDWPDYGTSFFDRLWREKGCTIKYMRYVRM